MHRHHVSTELLHQTRVELPRADSRHFTTVLRLKEGDEVQLFDGQGSDGLYTIASSVKNALVLQREGELVHHAPPKCRLILGACISKGARMDWTIEKAVELGASEIVPIASEFSVVRLGDERDAEAKRERWTRIAVDAARQSDAAYLPSILPPLPFDRALTRLRENDAIIVGALQPDARPLREVLADFRGGTAPRSAVWMTGPEGDFSPSEYQALREAGTRFVTLGDQILRAETAAMYGLCVLGSEWL